MSTSLNNTNALKTSTTLQVLPSKFTDKENHPPACSNCLNLTKQLKDRSYCRKLSNSTYHNTSGSDLYTHMSELDILPDESSLETGQVCPMCKHVEMEEDLLLQHVYSHFQESNDEDPCTVNTLEHAAVFPQFNI